MSINLSQAFASNKEDGINSYREEIDNQKKRFKNEKAHSISEDSYGRLQKFCIFYKDLLWGDKNANQNAFVRNVKSILDKDIEGLVESALNIGNTKIPITYVHKGMSKEALEETLKQCREYFDQNRSTELQEHLLRLENLISQVTDSTNNISLSTPLGTGKSTYQSKINNVLSYFEAQATYSALKGAIGEIGLNEALEMFAIDQGYNIISEVTGNKKTDYVATATLDEGLLQSLKKQGIRTIMNRRISPSENGQISMVYKNELQKADLNITVMLGDYLDSFGASLKTYGKNTDIEIQGGGDSHTYQSFFLSSNKFTSGFTSTYYRVLFRNEEKKLEKVSNDAIELVRRGIGLLAMFGMAENNNANAQVFFMVNTSAHEVSFITMSEIVDYLFGEDRKNNEISVQLYNTFRRSAKPAKYTPKGVIIKNLLELKCSIKISNYAKLFNAIHPLQSKT